MNKYLVTVYDDNETNVIAFGIETGKTSREVEDKVLGMFDIERRPWHERVVAIPATNDCRCFND